MNDKIVTLIAVLLLAAVIGVMSWRDMHPPEKKTAVNTNIVSGYYADIDAPPAIIPNDLPVTIAQGGFKYTPQGKVMFTPQGMPPATFAQQQVNVLFRFDSLPKDHAATLEEIETLMKAWERQGTFMTMIYIDYRPENPDFRAYSAFLKSLKAHFKADPHLLIPVIDVTWLEAPHRAGIGLLKTDSIFFLLDLHSGIPSSLIERLGRLEFNVALKLPAGLTVSEADKAALLKTRTFAGAMLTVDASHPLPKKERQIGVLPKF